MSLEAVLTENNTLLRELIALWKTGASPAPAPVAAPAVDKAPPPTETKVVTKAEPEKTAPAKEDAKTETAAGAVTYDQIKPLIIKVNTTKGRDAATALLKEFDVARGPDLKPEQYAKFFARATEVLA